MLFIFLGLPFSLTEICSSVFFFIVANRHLNIGAFLGIDITRRFNTIRIKLIRYSILSNNNNYGKVGWVRLTSLHNGVVEYNCITIKSLEISKGKIEP